jgi:mannose-6-phosphate isomerase-like protein (cupin superfamily)
MSIRVISFVPERSTPISEYQSHGASAVHLADGQGPSHAYVVHVAPGGQIGPHPAGFDQLFLVVQGSGWVAASDGVRQSISKGQAAFISAGELHSKCSEVGMVAVMLQDQHFKVRAAQ